MFDFDVTFTVVGVYLASGKYIPILSGYEM